jgi:acetolactate synthase-1/2/3 large subunit
MANTNLITGADLLIRRLADHGVECVFGYPGGQLTPIYDALVRFGKIRHILARDEQAAAFMADGYARATGKIGVCLAVCGPGVYNAFTPLATSFTDSIPVLLLSGQMHSAGLGLRSGYYHENEQMLAAVTLTKGRGRATSPQAIVSELDALWNLAQDGRPGPVFLEIPLDVQRSEISWIDMAPPPSPPCPLEPAAKEIEALAGLIAAWQRPLILAGGGVCSAGGEKLLTEIAERLGAPVFTSFMGKTAMSSDHPLKVGLPWKRATSDLTGMESQHSPLFAQADGLLVLGCRFSQACTGSWSLNLPTSLGQIDVDAAELGRHYPVTVGVQADAGKALQALLRILPDKPRPPWVALSPPAEPWRLPGIDLVGPLRRILPRDGLLVADITRLSYILLAEFPVYLPRTFLHPAGFVAMGYGIPAALGAKAAHPGRAVVTVVGDGCFLMSGMELATALQEKLPIVVVLINDNSLTLIKAIQERRYQGRFLGVDLRNPDFGLFAQAFGVNFWRVHDDANFEKALHAALEKNQPALIEVQL